MSSIERHITDRDSYEDALDHLVDTVPMSYDDAKRELNLPQYENTFDAEKEAERPHPRPHRPGRAMAATALTSSAERRAQSLVAHGPQHGEEEGVGYPNGEPHYYQPVQEVLALRNDHAQITLNQAHSARIRADMGWQDKQPR